MQCCCDVSAALMSVLVLTLMILSRRITPDHPFMSHVMNVMTEVNSRCSDHHKRGRFDQIKNNRKMRSHHLAWSEFLTLVLRHDQFVTSA